MSEKVYSINEFRSTVNADGFKFISLMDANGGTVIPFNSNKPDDTALQIKKICKILLRQSTLPDGFYWAVCTNSFNSGSLRTSLKLKKGNPKNESVEMAAPVKQQPKQLQQPDQNAIYSFKDLLDLHSKIAELTNTVARLTDKEKEDAEYIKQLEDEITELENGSDDDDSLSEGGQFQNTIYSSLAELFDGLKDKMLNDGKEKKEMADSKTTDPPKISKLQIFTLLYENPVLCEELNEFIKQKESENGNEQEADPGQDRRM